LPGSERVKATFKELNAEAVMANYIDGEGHFREIWAELKKLDRATFPVYAIFPAKPGSAPIMLNEIITQSDVIEGLKKAAEVK
jgi:hypothetical protein